MTFQNPYKPDVQITGVQDVAAAEPFLLPLCLTYTQYHDLLGALYFARGLYANPASGGFDNIDHMLSVLIAQQYISDPSNAPCWPDECLFCDKLQEIIDTLPAGPEEFILKIAETLIECCVGISLPPPVTTFPTLCDLLTEELGQTANLSQLITTAENCGITIDMNFTAEAITLAPGSDATATYNQSENKFTFGIPEGLQGVPGIAGEQGLPGPPGMDGEDGECNGCAQEATETERSGLTQENLCAAAERAATWFQSRMLDILDIAAAVSAFSEFTASVVTSPLEFVPVLNGLDDATVDNAFLAVNAAGLALATEINTTTEEALQCAIYCDLVTRFEGVSGTVSWEKYADKISILADEVYPSIASRGLALLTATLIGNDEISRQLYAYSFDENAACEPLCGCGDQWCYTITSFTGNPAITLLPRFGQSQHGNLTATQVDGQCLTNNGDGYSVRFEFPIPANVTRVTMNIDHDVTRSTSTIELAVYDENTTILWSDANVPEGTAFDVLADGFDVTTGAIEVRHIAPGFGCPGAIANLNSITFEGIGTNPFGSDNCGA